jgi:lysozyme
MKMTVEGLRLIREFEGFRSKAYRDAVGVWTIGYGHTSMAGAPQVSAGMTITREEAEKILERDVEQFSKGVSQLLTVAISDQQFSALVSFAYNVGLGNFKKSSVLLAVNGRDFQRVPQRLNLWVKAGGRVLPGLIRRRAAEGALFLTEATAPPEQPPEVMIGKAPTQSRTIITAVMIVAFTLFQAASRGQLLDWGSATLVVIGAIFIIRERILKSKLEGV